MLTFLHFVKQNVRSRKQGSLRKSLHFTKSNVGNRM